MRVRRLSVVMLVATVLAVGVGTASAQAMPRDCLALAHGLARARALEARAIANGNADLAYDLSLLANNIQAEMDYQYCG